MDLELFKVVRERKEFVVFKVLFECELGAYILFYSLQNEDDSSSDINRRSFIFPALDVKEGDYVVLYTGAGEYESFKNRAGTTTHKLYWGFNDDVHLLDRTENSFLLVKVSEYKRFRA